MKRNRKSLKTLQVAVGSQDKENLVGREKMPHPVEKPLTIKKTTSKETDIKLKAVKKTLPQKKKTPESTSSINQNVNDNINNNTAVTTNDLTSDVPSENYWQNLAESRRIALESALKENVDLYNQVNELEYENKKIKEMLEEARSLVQVLTEMLNDNETEETENDDSMISKEETADEISFKSCI